LLPNLCPHGLGAVRLFAPCRNGSRCPTRPQVRPVFQHSAQT
jgi:hypothetical protein